MAVQNEEGPQLQIRCPSCGQSFQVGVDLRGRAVECGACEHRFEVSDEVIVRVRKVYPGERHDPSLNRFQRVPLAASEPEGLKTVTYGNKPDPAHIEPVSPQRIMAGGIAVGGMIFMGLLLIFGAAQGGFLDGVPLQNRLVMAVFAAALGLALLVYANPKARLKAGLVGGLLAAGLVTIPFFFTKGSKALDDVPQDPVAVEQPEPTEADAADDRLKELRERIGTEPVEKEIARLEEAGGDQTAVGLYLIGLLESNTYKVRDYIIRATGGEAHPFRRDRGEVLLVVSRVDQSLEELAVIASVLGKIEALHPDIGIIEIRVNNENFVEGPIAKLSDKNDPAFYALNKRELESISLDRVSRAVERLAEAEPKLYRSDITRRLIELLGQEEIDFKESVSRALMVWAEEDGPASEAAMKVVRELHEADRPVPPEMVALIVKEKNLSLLPILDELWFSNATRWEGKYGDFGPAAELMLLTRFGETEGMIRHSAVRILGRAGGKASLSVLANAREGAHAELAVLIDQAEKSIRDRLSD